jgi:hypothetical protein
LAAIVLLGSQAAPVRADGFMAYAPFGGKIVFEVEPGAAGKKPGGLTVKPVMQNPGKAEPGYSSKRPAGQPLLTGGSKTPAPPVQVVPPPTYTVDVAKPVNDAWAALTAALGRAGPKLLAAEYVKGVSAYDVKLTFAPTGTFEAWADNGRVNIRCTFKGNKLAATLTTPSVQVGPFDVGLGSYADPRVELDFDVQLTIAMTMQLHAAPIVDKARVEIVNARLRSNNLVGDLLNGANALVKFFGGPDFKAKAENAINALGADANKPINSVFQRANPALVRLTKPAQSLKVQLTGNRIVVAYSPEQPQQQQIK